MPKSSKHLRSSHLETQGRKLLEGSGLKLQTAGDLDEAAAKAVRTQTRMRVSVVR